MATRPTPLVEERPVGRRRGQPEVCPRLRGCHASAVGTHEEAFADEIGLRDSFDGLRFLADCDRQGRQAHRATRETTADGLEHRTVEAVEAGGVDLEELEGSAGRIEGQLSVSVNLGVVDDAAQKAVSDTRRAARAREAISWAACASMGDPSSEAERETTDCSSSVS